MRLSSSEPERKTRPGWISAVRPANAMLNLPFVGDKSLAAREPIHALPLEPSTVRIDHHVFSSRRACKSAPPTTTRDPSGAVAMAYATGTAMLLPALLLPRV